MIDVDRLWQKLGRKQARLEEVEEAYESLLETLAKVVSGEIDRSRVMVNLTDKTVIWAPEGMRPEVPATINGVPRCIVAPAEDATAATVDAQRQVIEKLTAELKDARRHPRCQICDWPLRKDGDGCSVGHCCYVPKEGTEEAEKIRKRRAEIEAEG